MSVENWSTAACTCDGPLWLKLNTESAHFVLWEHSTVLRMHYHGSTTFICNEPLKAAFAWGLNAEALRAKDMSWVQRDVLFMKHFMVL